MEAFATSNPGFVVGCEFDGVDEAGELQVVIQFVLASFPALGVKDEQGILEEAPQIAGPWVDLEKEVRLVVLQGEWKPIVPMAFHCLLTIPGTTEKGSRRMLGGVLVAEIPQPLFVISDEKWVRVSLCRWNVNNIFS